jgi:hypothetical protein
MSDQKSKKEKHEGFLHKSYHLLFVIYAPLALISIALNVFSDKYINYVYMTAFLASGLSVILAAVMWFLFFKHREIIQQERTAKIPYLIRHQFILMYLPVAFTSMGLCSYYVYDKYVKTLEIYDQTALTNITLMLPIENKLGKKLEDISQIKLALGNLLINRPNITKQYHINIVDHKNSYDTDFEQIVLEQLKKGSDYFVCVYSDVCAALATNLDSLSASAGIEELPVIVTTLSSAMDVPLAKNKSYRFFVRNREDSQALSKYAFDKSITSASFIATNDRFGKDAVREFKKSWEGFGGTLHEGVYIDPLLSEEMASNKVLDNQAKYTEVQAVFIALYEPITNGLPLLSKDKTLLFSASYQHQQLDKLKALGANMDNIIVSLPQYKLEDARLFNTAGNFMYSTLNKLIDVDQHLTEGEQFHDAWIRSDEPAYLEFVQDGENDFSVSMEAKPFISL